VIDLQTGKIDESIDPATFDQHAEANDPDTSRPAPENASKIHRLPNDALVFDVVEQGKLKALILPIEGYGLWGTLYGYLALAPDARTIVGITFYKHKETPGLGGEVDNPRWKALWPGRLAFDDRGNPAISVKKGAAGPPKSDPYHVDGLSGATLTSRGVTNLLHFWLGENGFGPYLANYRAKAGIKI
jgi:Na+-transporting NADH:ubiquinone oxidoreductase subunit C